MMMKIMGFSSFGNPKLIGQDDQVVEESPPRRHPEPGIEDRRRRRRRSRERDDGRSRSMDRKKKKRSRSLQSQVPHMSHRVTLGDPSLSVGPSVFFTHVLGAFCAICFGSIHQAILSA